MKSCKVWIGFSLKIPAKSVISVQRRKELYITIALAAFFYRKTFHLV